MPEDATLFPEWDALAATTAPRKLIPAIARSVGNKAFAFSKIGHCYIVVQERVTGPDEKWLHVWGYDEHVSFENDIVLPRELRAIYRDLDPEFTIWLPL